MFLFSPLVIVPFLSSVLGSIGPSTDLHVVNKVISPDGFNRSYVYVSIYVQCLLIVHFRAVLVGSRSNNAAFPGPVVTGFKVS